MQKLSRLLLALLLLVSTPVLAAYNGAGPLSVSGGGTAGTTPNGARISLGASPVWQLVGTRTGLNGIGGKANGPGISGRIQHTLPYGALDLSFVYAGFITTQDGSGRTIESTVKPSGGSAAAVSAVVVSGGTGYAVGDQVVPSVAANQFAPTLMVTHVSGGAVTDLVVLYPGMFGSTSGSQIISLAQGSTTGSGTGLTVTLGVSTPTLIFRLGVEQVWGNQTAYSLSNLNGVLQASRGTTITGLNYDLVLNPSDLVVTDPLLVNLPARSTIASRVFTIGGPMYEGRYLSTDTTGSALGESINTSVTTDQSGDGTFPTITGQAFGFQPLAIMGHLANPVPSFAIIADSIGNGIAGTAPWDTGDQYGDIGWVERSLNIQWPWMNLGTRGDATQYWINALTGTTPSSGTTVAQLRMRALAQIRPSHVVDELCGNDLIFNATPAATLLTYKIKLWTWLRSIGVQRIWVSTCNPNTTSSNGWTDIAGQTLTAASPRLTAYNASLRSGAASAYVDRIIDITLDTESQTNPGYWQPGGTDDGVHPIKAKHAAIATRQAPVFATASFKN